MSKFGTLLGLKAVPEKPAAAAPAEPEKNVLELDQELFFPLASELGEENEAVRNLLIDAEHKITELEGIKRSLGRLVDPVSKTLRALEETKSEKLSLQGVLNNTRLAYGKLRDDLTATEKKAAKLEGECTRLRDVLTIAQQSVSALENTKSEQSSELSARRGQIADLQRHLQQQATDLQITREENQRLGDRVANAEKRMVQLEAEANASEQKFQLSEKERATLQALFDKALNDCAQMSRRVLETDKALNTMRTRLQQVEASYGEAEAERLRLANALEEATEQHRSEMNAQHARFEALHSRAELSEQLLEEARQTLAARADEIGAFDRRVSEATLTRDAIESKFRQIELALTDRDAQIRDLEQARATLAEQNETLMNAVSTRENAYNRAQERIQEQEGLIELLESQLRAAGEATELQIEELNAQLQRERLERTMAQGALEAGRKDIARLLRELAASQHQPGPSQSAETASPEAPARYRTAA
jgi:crescentin